MHNTIQVTANVSEVRIYIACYVRYSSTVYTFTYGMITHAARSGEAKIIAKSGESSTPPETHGQI